MEDHNQHNPVGKNPDTTIAPKLPDDNPSTDIVAYPGAEDEDYKRKRDKDKWQDFESQYSFALEQSVLVEREQWGSQCEFLMSCIASAVGLGNIWRFPFIAGENGGGAFLIPYLVVMIVIGRPLYMLELGLGQFCTNGPVKVWEMVPAFRGVGFGAVIASFFVASFYCVIMGWSLLYLYYSFFKTFPWKENITLFDGNNTVVHQPHPGLFFEKIHLGEPGYTNFNLTDFYQEKGLDGPPVGNVAIALTVSWLLVWSVMVGGVSGSGKIAYFTALFPYVVLLILLIGGCLLDGATDGIIYFFYPNFKMILRPKAWFQAVGQCFFSLGITFGGCIMFASFNSFHHKLGRDILVISIMDTFTSMLAGTCLFALIGNLAKKSKKTIPELAGSGGAGMAFVTFPSVLDALGTYPGPQAFSALFFFMIIVLAVGSANGLVGTVVTVICDFFPKWKRWMVVTAICITCHLIGLIYCCPTGNHVIDIVDRHGSEMVVYVVAIFEVIGVSWVYGLKNISDDMEFMLGGRINLYWQICWGVCLPFFLFIIFMSYLSTYKRDVKWPDLALYSAWTLTFVCWCVLPIAALVTIQTRKSSSFIKRLKASFYPTRKWGPKDPCIREAWRRWKKTKRVEYQITTKVLYALGLRPSKEAVDPEAYWAVDAESQYQSNASSQMPSVSKLPQGAEVAQSAVKVP